MKFIDFDWEEYINLSDKPKEEEEETDGNDLEIASEEEQVNWSYVRDLSLVRAAERKAFSADYLWEVQETAIIDPSLLRNLPNKCECGGSSVGAGHSPWCPAFDGAKRT